MPMALAGRCGVVVAGAVVQGCQLLDHCHLEVDAGVHPSQTPTSECEPVALLLFSFLLFPSQV